METRHLYWILTGPSFAVNDKCCFCFIENIPGLTTPPPDAILYKVTFSYNSRILVPQP
jgi:hypothetical protein